MGIFNGLIGNEEVAGKFPATSSSVGKMVELTAARVRELCRQYVSPKVVRIGRPRAEEQAKIALTLADDVGIAEACRRTGIARTTYYRHKKWMEDQQTT